MSLAIEADGEFTQKLASKPDPVAAARDYIALLVACACVLLGPAPPAGATAAAHCGPGPRGCLGCCAGGAAHTPAAHAAADQLAGPHPSFSFSFAADSDIIYSREIDVNLQISYLSVSADNVTDPFPTLANSGAGAKAGLVRATGGPGAAPRRARRRRARRHARRWH